MFSIIFVLIGTFVIEGRALNSSLIVVEQHLHNVEKVDITKVDFARTGKPLDELNQFAGHVGVLELLDHTLIPTDWKSIQFALKLRSNATVFAVELVQVSGRYTYKTTPDQLFHHMRADYDSRRFTLTITLLEDLVGFAVWDIRVDHNVSISAKQVQLLDRTLTSVHFDAATYLVKKSDKADRAFLNFTLEDPDSSKGYCFSTTTSQHTPIDVYVSAFGAKEVQKFTQFSTTRLQNEICLSAFIYVGQLGRFNISFTFAGDVKSDDGLMVNFQSGRIEQNRIPIKKVLPSYKDKPVRDGNPGWWFNNPGLYDYTVVADSKTPLYVCDILANCFSYDRKQIENHAGHKTVYNFTLQEKYKQLLSHSPLVRVHSEDSNFTIYLSSSYLSSSKIALNRIQSRLHTSYPKLQINSSDESRISYELEVPRQTRIPLEIPIELIDLRAQSIIVNIIPLNGLENRVNLVGVKVNGSDVDNIRDTQNDQYILSTGDYVQQAPWKMVSEVKSFGIEFEVERIGGVKMTHDLVGVQVEIYVDGLRRSFGGFGRIPEFDEENCHKGPTYGDLDCQYDEYVMSRVLFQV